MIPHFRGVLLLKMTLIFWVMIIEVLDRLQGGTTKVQEFNVNNKNLQKWLSDNRRKINAVTL